MLLSQSSSAQIHLRHERVSAFHPQQCLGQQLPGVFVLQGCCWLQLCASGAPLSHEMLRAMSPSGVHALCPSTGLDLVWFVDAEQLSCSGQPGLTPEQFHLCWPLASDVPLCLLMTCRENNLPLPDLVFPFPFHCAVLRFTCLGDLSILFAEQDRHSLPSERKEEVSQTHPISRCSEGH